MKFPAPLELSMLLESACNCISLDRAGWIIVMIRIPASITYANTLFERESRSWNTLLLLASQAKVSPKHAVCSLCTALPGMKSLATRTALSLNAHYCPLTSRFLHIHNIQQECNAMKLKNLWKVVEHFANSLSIANSLFFVTWNYHMHTPLV